MIEAFDVSIDKLVACGARSYSFELDDYLEETSFLKYRSIAKYPYREFFAMLDGSNIQVAEIEQTRKGNLKDLRVEFNPTKKSFNVEHAKMLRTLDNPHFTRIDVAFDFEVDMSSWRWIDLQARPQRHYYGRNGKLETVYVGGKDSNIIYRIYNKAEESKKNRKKNNEEFDFEDKGKKYWWRIEVQFRRESAQTFFENIDTDINIFDDVFPVAHYFDNDESKWDDFLKSGLDVKDRAMLHYLIDFPESFAELSPNTRSKYKKMMKSVSSYVGAHIRTVYKKNKPSLAEDLKHWYNFTCI